MMTMKEQLEQYLIEKSVAIDRTNKQFIAKLPLTHDPDETLMPNKNETRIRLKKVLQKTYTKRISILDIVHDYDIFYYIEHI